MQLPTPSHSSRRCNDATPYPWLIFLVLATGLLVVCPYQPLAQPGDSVVVTVENTTGVPAADLHVTFSGAGGDIFVDAVSVVALGCPVPSVPSNPPVVTNTAVIDWGVECVAPLQTVIFIARTANGPLGVVSADWTDSTGAVIGPAIVGISPLPPLPPLPFGALKVVSRYIGGGRIYSRPRPVNGNLCWGWWCWRLPRWCFSRVFFCPFSTRFFRFFELPPWIPITPWIHSAFSPLKCRWIEVTIPLPALGGPPAVGYQGPPPDGRDPGLPLDFDPFGSALDVRYSGDGGVTFRKTTDFTSTFLAICDSLEITTTDTLAGPVNTSLSAMLTEMAPGYTAASSELTPLIDELDSVRTAEPNPTLDVMRTELVTMQLAFNDVGTMLATGTATDSVPFQILSLALSGLATEIRLLPSPRFLNAADNLDDAAAMASLAASLINQGLNDPMRVSTFVYASYVRLRGTLCQFAMAMWPHIRVHVDLGNYVWYPSTVEAVKVIVARSDTGEPLDTLYTKISDLGVFDVPTMAIPDGTPLRIWFKLPTHLSVNADVVASDGAVAGLFPVVGGDANGDNCIDALDANAVSADFGLGGPLSFSTPPTDVNGDGLVDLLDANLVAANFGLCGDEIGTAVPDAPIPRFPIAKAFPNPFTHQTTIRFELPADMRLTIRVYNVRGEVVATLAQDRLFASGPQSINFDARGLSSGIYFCRVAAGVSSGEPVSSQVIKMTLIK